MDLSIIIPAFNEKNKIAADIAAADAFLQQSGLIGEIIIADDSSTDGTAQTAESARVTPPTRLKVVRSKVHRGKGAAVRAGMLQAGGTYRMFADSGLTVPFRYALDGLKLLQEGACEIAHASRYLPESHIVRPQAAPRRLLSRIFHHTVVRSLQLGQDFTDTQCGFKIYKGEAAEQLYRACRTNGFLFDLEIILRARRLDLRIREFPVEWRCDPDSRLAPWRNLPQTIIELLQLRRVLR